MRPNGSRALTRREALAGAARRLAGASETPRLDAELLLASALAIERQALLLSDLNEEAPAAFEQLVARREKGEPIAYIVGRRGFWTIELEVAPGVLVPRPDSETLIEAAVAHFGANGPRSILDLGTGSGALLLAALDQWPTAQGVGVDRCERALAIARANGERLGLADRAQFRLGDWGEGLEQRFDLILCNPPYVDAGADLPRDVAEWEPHEALFAGADGLDDYRRIAPQISGLLGQDGIACIEIGLGQAPAVTALFAAEGLRVDQREDLGGRTRCLILTR
ncbi:peptide chain release factor N(5)-glutamine methyltransferase [Sphingomonas sp.]|uniref:peptide chain release factor N(5)-glutamine methyltransferase n=1 Tax=Sphingomonas sp. TaxID=28214 RepID=UPI003FA7CEFA